MVGFPSFLDRCVSQVFRRHLYLDHQLLSQLRAVFRSDFTQLVNFELGFDAFVF